jgi:hypothetical protein
MADAVSNTFSAIQSAYHLTKSIADLNEAHAIKVQLGELLAQILSAQESALRSQDRESALTRQVHVLEDRIAQMETWNAEKQRYQLTDFGSGTFAYLLNPDQKGSDPTHRLCAACFQKREQSILQFKHRNNYGQEVCWCPNCKSEFAFGNRSTPTMPRVQRTRY